MFQSSLKLLNRIQIVKTISKDFSKTSIYFNNEKWDLLSAVCLERKPVITPELNDFEKKYKQYLTEIELERSLKSDFELKNEEELKQIELLKTGNVDDIDINLKQTVQDFADAALDELNNFKFASRLTEADEKNDVKSLNRKLDKHLVLVLNQKIGDKKYYLLPQGKLQTGETLRQTAERILKESCGVNVKANIYGNAPCGFYKYKYPKKTVEKEGDAIGAKVKFCYYYQNNLAIFIYFARFINGEMPGKGIDYKWLDRIELDKILPPNYKESVTQILIEE